MKTRMALTMLFTIAALIFVTCTGCAGIYVGADGRTIGYAIGEAEATKKEGVTVERICLVQDRNRLPVRSEVYRPRVVEISSPYVKVKPLPSPTCDNSQVAFKEITVKGGKLGAGWFSAFATFVMAYFGGGLVP